MDKTVYIARAKDGSVASVSLVSDDRHDEPLSGNSPELTEFYRQTYGEEARFVESDLALVRVLEDLIEVLIDKDVLRFTDLPAAAQKKLVERRSIRGLTLFSDSDNGII